MDAAHGAGAAARGDHRVEVGIGTVDDSVVVVEADATDHGGGGGVN